MKEQAYKFNPLLSVLILTLLWSLYCFEYFSGLNFNYLGIDPRKAIGLRGLIFAPLLHGSVKHLFNNSVALFVLINALFYFYRDIALRVFLLSLLFSGLGTWIFGRSNIHIGASGLVYGLFGFIIVSGLLRKNYRLMALALALIFWYGGLFWYLFPIEEHISWEGHSSGFACGVLLAFLYRRKGPSNDEYVFEKTEFDNYFDEDGNLKSSLSDGFIEEGTASDRNI
ncbi:MAG: rhomboid family intramembrane serine protease [Flavobacteriaceae bacterium]